MLYVNKDTNLSVELLHKMINHFIVNVEPKLEKYKNYYDGVQAILNKAYRDPSKPCNRSVINYCRNIVDSYTGYLATPGYISYSSENDIDEIMNILRYNDYQSEDGRFLQDALVYGVATELMYHDNEGQTRFRLIDPRTCFGVYDDSLTGDLLYFVRIYKESEWDNSNKYLIDVYDDNIIMHYSSSGRNGQLKFIGAEQHYFSQCPVNIFMLPDEKSIFDCIMSLQDSVNELLSAEIDDYQAFCDAYLAIEDAELDQDSVKEMKENRVLLLPAGSKAYWITKATNDVQIENILRKLHDSIYSIACCPDFNSEKFVGGVSSGIAIQYRLCGMENKAGAIEGEMKKALQRRVEIICGIASLKLGEEVFRDIQITFKRNIPDDLTTSVNVVNGLRGLVSDETLLEQIPFVTDVPQELEKLGAQKQSNIDLYGGGLFNASEDDSEEDEKEETGSTWNNFYTNQ